MGRSGWASKFWRCHSSSMTSNDEDHGQPSTSGTATEHASTSRTDVTSTATPASDPVSSLQQFNVRELCDELLINFRDAEDVQQAEITGQIWPSGERRFWSRLACFPVLQQLFISGKPDYHVLAPYFPKGENDATTLTYMIFRDKDIPRSLQLAVGVLCVGASLENWPHIGPQMMKKCLEAFGEMCYLAKLLHDLKSPMYPNSKLEKELQKGPEFLVEGSIVCAIHANRIHLLRYLEGCSYPESLKYSLRKIRATQKALRLLSERFIFKGITSSPLVGRPGMSYPHHAVGIEGAREEIVKMLEWHNQRQNVAVIISGPPGSGKSTVADAVFTSLHIPLCNYIRLTCIYDKEVRLNNWQRYFQVREGEQTAVKKEEEYYEEEEEEDYEEESEEETSGDNFIWPESRLEMDDDLRLPQDLVYLESRELYEESEKAVDLEFDEDKEEDQEEEEDEHEHEHGKFMQQQQKRLDLHCLEAEDAAAAVVDVCNFIYLDNPVQRVFYHSIDAPQCSKQRILVTTRDVDKVWDHLKEVLTEDCIYKYDMASQDCCYNQNVLRCEQVSKQIMARAMGSSVWDTLQWRLQEQQHYLARVITLCEGLPGWLVMVAKYIAAAEASLSSPFIALQRLLFAMASNSNSNAFGEGLVDGHGDDNKWEKLMKVMTEDCLDEECMEALQLISKYLKETAFLVWPYLPPAIEDVQDLIEERVLKTLQDRGLLLLMPDAAASGFGTDSVRVPYLVYGYCATKLISKHSRDIGSPEDVRMLEEELNTSLLKTPCINALRIDFDQDYEMDANKLHAMTANTLRMLVFPPLQRTVQLKGINEETAFNRLLLYGGRQRLPWHVMPSIRRIIYDEAYKYNDDDEVFSGRICQSLRYLNLRLERNPRSSFAMENIAKLNNLRAFTLKVWEPERATKIPDEFCVFSNIQELIIYCPKLYELPQNFGELRCLKTLRLWCEGLRQLPRSFATLPSLMEVEFQQCESLQKEEANIDYLCNVRWLQKLCWWDIDTLREEWWEEMVKIKRLTFLGLDPTLHEQSKRWHFGPHVEILYDRFQISNRRHSGSWEVLYDRFQPW